VPFAVQIGLVSGLLEFIPYLGGIVGLVLSLLSAATIGPTTMLLVVAIEAVIGGFPAKNVGGPRMAGGRA